MNLWFRWLIDIRAGPALHCQGQVVWATSKVCTKHPWVPQLEKSVAYNWGHNHLGKGVYKSLESRDPSLKGDISVMILVVILWIRASQKGRFGPNFLVLYFCTLWITTKGNATEYWQPTLSPKTTTGTRKCSKWLNHALTCVKVIGNV